MAGYIQAVLAATRRHGYDAWDLHQEARHEAAHHRAPSGPHFNAAGHQLIAAVLQRLRAAERARPAEAAAGRTVAADRAPPYTKEP